jgi:site-specific recombinase XerC
LTRPFAAHIDVAVTVILRLAALRFFYIHVLKRGLSIAETPYPKKVRHLPGVLSQEEVTRLIEAADSMNSPGDRFCLAFERKSLAPGHQRPTP